MKTAVLLATLLALPALTIRAGESEAASAQVDRLLAEHQAAHQVEAYPKVDDATFLRRAYLDLAGRIPTYQEAQSFYTTKDANKRANLVDELVASDAWNAHFFNWWADLLRAKTRLPNQVPGAPEYIDWIKQQVRDNTPYDKVVYELITASGYPRDNPAVGYYVRDNGMPLDNMSNTAQIFLGTQLQCAQCHDHPFDEWTQKDFYEMAAHTFGVKTRQRAQEVPELRPVVQQLQRERFQEMRKMRMQGKRPDRASMRPDPTLFRAFQELFSPFTFGALPNPKPLRLPDDYPYDNAKPKQQIDPKVPFGPEPDYAASKDPREAYATWMTSPENPRFTKVIANRMWKKVFGRGLFEPLDDLTKHTKVSHPGLLDFLCQEMIRLDYDLKAFTAMLCKTELYQRGKHTRDLKANEVYAFPGPIMRRMSAEQIWDSVITLAARNVDTKKGPPSPQPYGDQAKRAEVVLSKQPEEVLAMARELAGAEKEFRDQFIAMREKARDMSPEERRRMGRSQFNLNRARQQKVSEIIGTDETPMMGMMGMNRNNYQQMLVRASELPSPMPPGHFLRQFGQSDREVIENAHTDASIPQALNLMNGKFSQVVLNPESPLRDLADPKAPLEVADKVFISIMTRPPDAQDRTLMREQLTRHGRMGMVNIAWALVNTQEFLFIP